MPVPIPTSHIDLLEGPVFVALVTVMPNGTPQVTPVWANTDGTHVLVNSARGRQKDKNMRANPKVAILAIDPKNGYRWIEIRGTVTEITEEGGVDHINALSKLYRGDEDYYGANSELRSQETRVKYKITPEHINKGG
ncbi:MAG: PPOX class F420-dependent oxidoreductase [Chloroflexi bacterium]|nr:MAG: PPOX class F420-dependent oxidoreductase [Chloroflexota bacterium]